MHLRYEEDFVEAAVGLCAGGRCRSITVLQIARFNHQREKLYSILDPDARNEAFFRLHLDWFREWGLEELLTGLLNQFSLLSEALELLAFRKPYGRHDEGAELYVNEAGDRNGVLALRPERLENEAELKAFLRHELTHLHDMVDPAFGYDPTLPVTGPCLGSHSLARERYRLLWDVSIDGRLSQHGCRPLVTKEQRWSEFSAGFSFWPEARQQCLFQELWTDPAPSHRRFLELLSELRPLQAGASPGAPCPLCGFPTFNWADASRLGADTVDAIRAEFPFWTAESGLCARCAEMYRVNRSHLLSRA